MMVDSSLLTKKEKIESCQSLSCLLHYLRNSLTTIELRNEFRVVGTIDHVDAKTNLTVSDAVIQTLNDDCHSQSYAQVFIPANQIRNIHIPNEVDIMQVLRKASDSLNTKTIFKKRRLWKARQERHLETKAIVRAYKLGRGRLKQPEKEKE